MKIKFFFFIRTLSLSIFLTGILASLPVRVEAGITRWTGSDGDGAWTTAGNWDNGVPEIANNTYIGSASPGTNNAAVTLGSGDQESWQIFVGHAANTTGTVTMTGGTLTTKAATPASPVMFVGNSGNGTFIQNGGVVTNLDLQPLKPYLSIGHAAGSVGRYELNSGILAGFSHLGVGYSGTGTFVQEAGATNSILYLMLPASGGHGTYILNGGMANFGIASIGNGMGILNQNAGEFISRDYVRLGVATGGTGIYTMDSGSLTVSNLLTLGFAAGSYGKLDVREGATATLRSASTLEAVRIGDGGDTTTGILMLQGGTVNVVNVTTSYIYIGDNGSLADGSIQGWGILNTDARLYFGRKARVVADGFGEDHTLAITGYNLILNYANPADTTNGWYAQNGGALQLGGLAVSGNGIKVWGGNNSSSLVNTVTWNFTGVTGSGTITGSLYAADHSEVPRLGSGSKPIGIWNFERAGFNFSSASLTVRYDTATVAALGLDESALRLYQYLDGESKWIALETDPPDTVNKLVTATGVTGLGFFAVGEINTTRGSIFMIR